MAGVAAAIGERYGIDPVLPRVAFVVGMIYGGAGLVLYLLGWLAFPKEVDAQTPQRAQPTAWQLVLALFLLLVVVPRTGLSSWLAIAVGLGVLVMLHHYRGQPALPAESATDAVGTEGEEPATPPEWDPLGAAPFAWDLSDPAQAEPEKVAVSRSRWVTPVGLVLAAFAAVLAQAVRAPFIVTLAVTLAVLGAGMVVGAFLHGGRALMWFAIPVTVLALAINVVPHVPFSGVHDVDESPSTIADVQPHYGTSVGTVVLRLNDLRMAPDQQIHTNVGVGVGSIRVFVPKDADVTAQCSSNVGSVHCLGGTQNGLHVHQTINDTGVDGHIVLGLTTGVGDVEVVRE